MPPQNPYKGEEKIKNHDTQLFRGLLSNRNEEESPSPYGLQLNQEAVDFVTADVFVKPIANNLLKTEIYLELEIILSKKGWTTLNST